MRILMLVNWKVKRCKTIPEDMQPPDYRTEGEPYWFFRYFKEKAEVDVEDIRSIPLLEKFEKNFLRFYVLQTIRILPRLKKYDLILSHGMQSGILLCLLRTIFRIRHPKHIIFDIGGFNSAAESGRMLKLMQFAGRSIDGIIYHTGKQTEYYREYYPWLLDKSRFIRFGTDTGFFQNEDAMQNTAGTSYILCVGYGKRDWDTLIKAYSRLSTDIRLRLIGNDRIKTASDRIESLPGIPVRDLIKQIKDALFCVLPLKYMNYSFGQMTLLQQMALKKAVITARVPSMTDYVRENTDALLYEPNNDRELAEKMEYLIHNREERERIGNQACLSVTEVLNERRMAYEIENYIFETGSFHG